MSSSSSNEDESSTSTGEFRGKSLVLCFDGTGSKFGERPASNVLKIYQMIEPNSKTQIHYYQPGIGTYICSDNDFDFVSSRWRTMLLKLDAMIAYSFDDHILAGYKFLVRHYSQGDRIWMFGFSRGAFTARILSSMIERVGLLGSGGEELIPCAWEIYKNWENHAKIGDPECRASRLTDQFRQTFSQTIPGIYFLGLWDSINSVGLVRNRMFPHTRNIKIVQHLRHAVSVDERRSKFKQNLYHVSSNGGESSSDVVERWFPGNHGDNGGGWRTTGDNGALLADLSLRWMVKEANLLGLNFREGATEALAMRGSINSLMVRAHDMLSFDPDLGKGKYAAAKWWILELLPLPYLIDSKNNGEWSICYKPNFGRRRKIPNGAVMHWSVRWKKILDEDYRPKNIPRQVSYDIDRTDAMPDDLLDEYME
ncbi:hypothetical protein V1511DRAFT_459466 [Dipodascopsis uninucleata]